MGYSVAVVGATGNVGREMMAILEELQFPVAEIFAVASRKSKGVEVSFGERTLKCEVLDTFDFSKVDIVLMSAGKAASLEWSEKIGKPGPIVIDNSSAFRMDPDIKLTVTCVRVPVFVGHSEAVTLEFDRPIEPEEARAILRDAPGVMVIDKHEDDGYITPVDAAGDHAVFVSRIRKDHTVENGLSLWVVSDNLRKGAALNAVQIAQLLDEQGMLKTASGYRTLTVG